MKNKIYACVAVLAFIFAAHNANAQCNVAGRYIDTIFTGYTLDSVTYSDTFAQKMDIYQPIGDTSSSRPLVVLAHGGSFIGGTREDDVTITELCADLASKGYVTASIDYRLTSVLGMADSTTAITEVMQSISDFKAAVRYFYKDVYTNGNSYKIDTARIFIGGNSAGAVSAVHYAYIDSIQMVPAYLQGIINANGGLEGNSGNPGYSSKIRGVVNLAGGLNHPEWITACSLPIVSAQGTADNVVPYTCADAENGLVPVRLCGLGSMQPYITTNALYYSSILFPGQGHVPWQSNAGMMYQVDTIVTNFLNRAQCTVTPTVCPALATGINSLRNNAQISLFPNPANDVVNIQSSEFISSIAVFDGTGRMISETNSVNGTNYQLNTSALSKGVYLVKIFNRDEELPSIHKVVIE
jgi:para-nitrobenzyl esterase